MQTGDFDSFADATSAILPEGRSKPKYLINAERYHRKTTTGKHFDNIHTFIHEMTHGIGLSSDNDEMKINDFFYISHYTNFVNSQDSNVLSLNPDAAKTILQAANDFTQAKKYLISQIRRNLQFTMHANYLSYEDKEIYRKIAWDNADHVAYATLFSAYLKTNDDMKIQNYLHKIGGDPFYTEVRNSLSNFR